MLCFMSHGQAPQECVGNALKMHINLKSQNNNKKMQIPDSLHRMTIENKTCGMFLETTQEDTAHTLHSVHAGGF